MAGSGWAIQPQINRNHTAVFETDKVADGEPMRLTVRMDQKWGKGSYLLGRFRLSFTNDSGTLNATKFRLELKDNELAARH